MNWKHSIIPTVLVVTSTAALTWTSFQASKASFNEIQPVEFSYNLASNENNWYKQPPTMTVNLFSGSPNVSYAIVPEGQTPTTNDYIAVNSSTAGYQSQYRYRYITRETTYAVQSPGAGWSKSGNQKQEDYWKAVRTETGITPGELKTSVDRYFAIESNGTHTKLTNRIEDEVPTTVAYDTIYRYEPDGFYHTKPAYYATGQPVPVVWQGKYTKTTGPSSLYRDNYLKVQWNTDPNRTLYKYDRIWAPMSTTDYLPLLLGTGQNAHVESSPYRDSGWWSNFSGLSSKNQGNQLVGVDFKKTAYQRAKRTTYEWVKDTDSGYLYTANASTSQTKPAGTIQHEQTTVITRFQVSIPTNGKYQLYVKQSDGLGNTKVTSSNVIQVDQQTPTFAYTIEPDGLLSYTASDSLSGIASVKLPTGVVSRPTTAGTKTHSGSLTLRNEGNYAFEVTDLAGNTKTFMAVFEKDYQAPTATHTLSPTRWTNQSVTINLTATDTSGIRSILLPDNRTVNASSASYTVSQSGTYPFLITDRAGNSLSYLVTVSTIDKENPVTSLSASTTDWTNQPVQLTVSAKDAHSGVKSLAYQVNGGSWNTISNNGKVNHTSEGTFRYRAKSTDQAGNTHTTGETTIRVDLTKPTATHQLSNTAATNQPVTITVKGSDTLSGVKEIQSPNGVKTNGSSASFTASTNGTYTFLIIDHAGNVLEYPVKITNIDNGAPTLTLTVDNPESWSRSKTIKVSASDSQGVSWIKLPNGNLVYQSSTTYTVTENNYYYFEAADTVGNVTRAYLYVGKIDRELPYVDVENYAHNLWSAEDVEVNVYGGD